MDTYERVRKAVSEALGVAQDEVTRDASITDDFGPDSMNIMETMMALEEEFDIDIPDDDAPYLTTVQQIVDYIERKTSA